MQPSSAYFNAYYSSCESHFRIKKVCLTDGKYKFFNMKIFETNFFTVVIAKY
jgi:hypothetical protein